MCWRISRINEYEVCIFFILYALLYLLFTGALLICDMPKDETRVFLHTRDNQPAQRSTLLYLVYAAHTTVRLFSPPLNCVFKALRWWVHQSYFTGGL